METNMKKIPHVEFWKIIYGWMLYFDLRPGPKILFQGNTPDGSDTFQRPVIERDCVGALRLMIWDKVKVPLWHCAPMEWTPRPLVDHLREQERHNVTVITVGSKYEVYVRSPAPSHMQTLEQPFRNLAIKWEVKILLKKSSCVFILHCFFLCLPLASFCVRLYYWVVMIQHMSI